MGIWRNELDRKLGNSIAPLLSWKNDVFNRVVLWEIICLLVVDWKETWPWLWPAFVQNSLNNILAKTNRFLYINAVGRTFLNRFVSNTLVCVFLKFSTKYQIWNFKLPCGQWSASITFMPYVTDASIRPNLSRNINIVGETVPEVNFKNVLLPPRYFIAYKRKVVLTQKR